MSDPTTAEYRPDACPHHDQELRLRTYGDGTTHYVMQCLRCGAERRKIKKSDPLITRLADLPPAFDAGLTKAYWDGKFAAMKDRRDQERAEELERRRAAYHAYLLTPEWRAKRDARIRFDRGRCQAQLAGCVDWATEVHHLTYAHVGNEPLFELVSVCAPCHDQITAMDHGEGERDDRLAS